MEKGEASKLMLKVSCAKLCLSLRLILRAETSRTPSPKHWGHEFDWGNDSMCHMHRRRSLGPHDYFSNNMGRIHNRKKCVTSNTEAHALNTVHKKNSGNHNIPWGKKTLARRMRTTFRPMCSVYSRANEKWNSDSTVGGGGLESKHTRDAREATSLATQNTKYAPDGGAGRDGEEGKRPGDCLGSTPVACPPSGATPVEVSRTVAERVHREDQHTPASLHSLLATNQQMPFF